MSERQYRKLTRSELFKVMSLLHSNLAQVREGVWVYELGWSDQRVVDQAIPDFPGDALKVVKQIRRDEFGELAPPSPPPVSMDQARLAVMERRFARLCDQLGLKPEDLD